MLGLSALLLLGACATVEDGPKFAVQGPFMPSGMTVDAPSGYIDMCQRDAALCADPTPALSTARNVTAATVDLASAALAGDRLDDGQGQPRLMMISWAQRAPAAAEPAPAPVSDAAPTARPVDDAARMDMLNRVNRYVNGGVIQRLDASVNGDDDWRRSGVGQGARGDCKDIAVEKRLELIQQGFPASALFYAIGFREDIGLHAVLIAHTEAGDMVLDSRSPYIVSWSQAPYLWVKRQSSEDPRVWSMVSGPPQAAAPVRVAALDLNNTAVSASIQTH